jgi:segregation and condensation protein A
MEIKFKLDNFEGPLDLMLHLVEKKELNINSINISAIIDEYMEYIENAKNDNLAIKTEFLLMASELLEIKALSVLNKKEKEEKEENLEQRILEYKRFKELAEKLSELEQEYNIPYTKSGEVFEKAESTEIDLSTLTMQRIFDEYRKYTEVEKKEEMKINIEPLFSVEDGVTEVRERLTREKKFEFASLLANNYTRVKIIALFLALLELYKSGEIDINGENKIMIEVRTA